MSAAPSRASALALTNDSAIENLVLSNSYKTTNDVLSKEITIFAAVQLLLTAPLKMKVKAGSKKGETLSYKTDDYLRK